MRSVVERNVFMRCMTVYILTLTLQTYRLVLPRMPNCVHFSFKLIHRTHSPSTVLCCCNQNEQSDSCHSASLHQHSFLPNFTSVSSFYHKLSHSNPVAARSTAGVGNRSFAGIPGSNPAGGNGRLPLVSVVCCQVEVSATGRSLDQGSRTVRVCVF